MPPLSGEECMLTVFADIHYYFTAPNPKPLLHRFDKGSYLYLYHNAALHTTRIEVANNPGTQDQDAFNGTLDHVHLRHSTRFPTLCTLTVDGQGQAQAYPPPPSSTSPYDWQLPSHDPRGETTIQRLNTLDIYFWTQDDADQFLDLAERYLPSAQVETDRHPYQPASETHATSTIVQQLENVAITDPAYQNGQTRNSQSEVVPNPGAHSVSPGASAGFPPPPLSGPPPQQPSPINPSPAEQKRDSAQFAPLPYNPAAPAAPEPIKHREKTPPPPDAGEGTGLAAAMAADQGILYSAPSQLSGGVYTHRPTQSQAIPYSMPGSYASPPPSAGLTRAGTFPLQASSQGPSGLPPYSPGFPAGAGPHHAQGAPMMSFAPPPTDQNAHLAQEPSLYGTQVPAIGGYSDYSYDQTPRQHRFSSEYDVHNQMYRPTEAEAKSHLQKHAQLAVQNPGQRPRKLEDSAMRMENSVNRFLKKLERKI
ncbi:hypothetical protein P175DRAFT_0437937 [Aspergillus ochraceoroseus IBT 24754]|uniref:RNA recognition motif-containing protein n=2 Tax=Aspergillus ochraceoroseus TaxID=138278 RepID=A0A2T5LX03_9EURO|nr:uncharacterized protein P175DRAFT_0437937 [Aspergillus ochraceoroseus IBT 24754]KKK19596.1 hypothetical protein AOCH_001306 [Aspergillus ochraceoroseus]PTU20814.1 hypothetical protein P175DRAFT_0437937 [Aspergillus ochraceoroseus IBT 24754]